MYEIIDEYVNELLLSTPARPLWNVENITLGKQPHWNYIDGCMMTALLCLFNATKEKKYLSYVDSFEDYYVDKDGRILGYCPEKYNLDDLNGGRVLFDLWDYTQRTKYAKAIHTLSCQLKAQPRIKEGNFWHKLIYPRQVWLDGLYMAQVFYAKCAEKIDDRAMIDDIVKQFKFVFATMFDADKRLLYHAYDDSKTMFWAQPNGCSKNFWLRSIGWYCAGLADVIELLTDADDKKQLGEVLRAVVDGLLTYIDVKEDMFYQVVDRKDVSGNYLETSGSAMVAYSLLCGARNGVLPSNYATIGKRIFDGICKRYLRHCNGRMELGGICLVAGLGPKDNLRRDGSVEYYLSEPVVKNDAKGVAPFLMAYSEILRMLRKT